MHKIYIMLPDLLKIGKKQINDLIQSESLCLEWLAAKKWGNGFVCRKCGNEHYCSGKKPLSRRCTRCKTEESVTSSTLFHGCRMPLNDAFAIVYKVLQNPDISSYQLSEEVNHRQMTCWKIKKMIQDIKKDKNEK